MLSLTCKTLQPLVLGSCELALGSRLGGLDVTIICDGMRGLLVGFSFIMFGRQSSGCLDLQDLISVPIISLKSGAVVRISRTPISDLNMISLEARSENFKYFPP